MLQVQNFLLRESIDGDNPSEWMESNDVATQQLELWLAFIEWAEKTGARNSEQEDSAVDIHYRASHLRR